MLGLAITFAILALIAGILGFMALAGTLAVIAKVFLFRFPGPLRDIADLRQEETIGSLIFDGVGSLVLRLPRHR